MAHVSTDIADSSHASSGLGSAPVEAGHQQPPIKVYLVVWGLLFILSMFSYLVDYVGLQGGLRWTLILVFMVAKAGLIMAIFMHLAWERLALSLIIILPPIALLVFVAIMATESNYVVGTRETFFSATK